MKLLFVFALFMQFTIFSQTITTTLTLNGIPENIQCNETWTEEGLNLSFVNTTEDDCASGNCSFGVFSSTSVMLFPSRLTVDLSSLPNIQSVEVDILDNCGTECTKAFLIDGSNNNIDSASNGTAMSAETLTLENINGGSLSKFAVSSCEGEILEIRIYQNDVTSGSEDVFEAMGFTIYPNPSTSVDDLQFNISTLSAEDFPISVDMMSMDGKLIYRKDITSLSDSHFVIPSNVLSQGIFFLKVKSGNKLLTKKIIRH